MKPIFSLIVLIQVRYQRFTMDYVELMNHTLVGNYTTPKHAFKRCNRTQVLKPNNNFEVMAFMNLRSHLPTLFLGACPFFPRDVGFLLNQSFKSIVIATLYIRYPNIIPNFQLNQQVPTILLWGVPFKRVSIITIFFIRVSLGTYYYFQRCPLRICHAPWNNFDFRFGGNVGIEIYLCIEYIRYYF